MKSFSILPLLFATGSLAQISIFTDNQPQVTTSSPSLATSTSVLPSTTNKKVCKPKTSSALPTCQVTSTIFQTQSGFATCTPIYSTVTAYPSQNNATYTLATSFVTATVTDTIFSTITAVDTVLQTQVASLTTIIDKNFTSVITIPQTITNVETVLETEIASLTTILAQNLTSIVTLSQPFPITIPVNATSVVVVTSTAIVTVTETASTGIVTSMASPSNTTLTSSGLLGPSQTTSLSGPSTTSATSTSPSCAEFALHIENGNYAGTYLYYGLNGLSGGGTLQQAMGFQISSGSGWLYYTGYPVLEATYESNQFFFDSVPSSSAAVLVCSISALNVTTCQSNGNTIFATENDNGRLGLYQAADLLPGNAGGYPASTVITLNAQCLVTSGSPSAPAPPPAEPSCAYSFLNFGSSVDVAVLRNSTLTFVNEQNTGAFFSFNNATGQFANGNYPLSAARGQLSPVFSNFQSSSYFSYLTCAIDQNNDDTTTCQIESGDSLYVGSGGKLEIATPAELQNDGLSSQPTTASIRAICTTLIESGSTPGATAAATTTGTSSTPTATNPASCQYVNLYASNGMFPGSYVSPTNNGVLQLGGNQTYAATFALDSSGLLSYAGYPVSAQTNNPSEVVLYDYPSGVYVQLSCTVDSASDVITCAAGSENILATGPNSSPDLYATDQDNLQAGTYGQFTEVTLIAQCAPPPSTSSLCPSFSLTGYGNSARGVGLALNPNNQLIDSQGFAAVGSSPTFSIDATSGALIDNSNNYRAYVTADTSSNITFAGSAPSQSSLLTCSINLFPETTAGGIFTCTSQYTNQNVFSAVNNPFSDAAQYDPFNILFAQDSALNSQEMSRVNIVATCMVNS